MAVAPMFRRRDSMSQGSRLPRTRRRRGWGRGGMMAAYAAVAFLLARTAPCPQLPEAWQPLWASAPQAVVPSDTDASSDTSAGDGLSTYRFAAAPRVVALGDVHGNLPATRKALQMAGAIDSAGNWAGGKLVLVQVGDQLDRGNDERPLLDWFKRLSEQAEAAGGAVHVLNGNHEAMNVAGDYHSVTPGGLLAFAGFLPRTEDTPAVFSHRVVAHGRAAAFMPGCQYARLLAERNAIIVVGTTLFAHGGVLPQHVEYGIGRINSELRRWMSGGEKVPPRSVYTKDSPLWTRYYSAGQPTQEVCSTLKQVLSAVGATRMVVGHTIQEHGISSACGGRVYRIDVGVSGNFGGEPQLLEITRHGVQVIAESPALAWAGN